MGRRGRAPRQPTPASRADGGGAALLEEGGEVGEQQLDSVSGLGS
jgi:hypothetical protein